MPEPTTHDVALVLPEGRRYDCPACGHPHDSLAAKKAHIKRKHPRPKRGGRRHG